MDSFARIAVVGLGYIGLPTAAVFAENGLEVGNPRATQEMFQVVHLLDCGQK